MIVTRRMVYLVFICLFSMMFIGCVETATMFQGNKPSKSMNVVPLQKETTQAETWQTYEVIINYKYMQSAEMMEISGQATLSASYQANYNSLRELTIYLFFLDEDSRVLQTVRLANSVTTSVDEVVSFSSKYAVPAGTTSITFGYDGSASGSTGRIGGGASVFSELPLRKE